MPQVAIMVVICAVVLVDQGNHLSSAPFSWSHLDYGLAGLSAGFPLALYMLIGWENAPALAEETRNPRRTVLLPSSALAGLTSAGAAERA
jgi:amino acid transporter